MIFFLSFRLKTAFSLPFGVFVSTSRERRMFIFERSRLFLYTKHECVSNFFAEKVPRKKQIRILYLKRIFFLISSSLSRARICAHLRAHIISLFFLRARAHAREKVTRIAIIDRPLSMIVGGRVGALFFIVCFLSVLEIQIERFCISPPAWQMNE